MPFLTPAGSPSDLGTHLQGPLFVGEALVQTSVSPAVLAGFTVFDDFGRVDTAPGHLGTTPTGHVWDLRGSYVSGYPLPAATTGQILNGTFVTSGGVTVYATQTLRVAPSRIGARVRWSAGNGGSQHGTIALIISSDANFINDMLHFHTDPNNWALQIRIAGGAFVDLALGAFSPALSVDGTTSYPMEMSVVGNTVTLNLAGQVTSVTDSRVAARLGKWVVWEHSYNNAPTYQDFLSIESVWTGSSAIGTVLGGTFQGPITGVTDLTASGVITTASASGFGLTNTGYLYGASGNSGQWTFTNAAVSAGVELDVTTDATARFMTRSNTDAATVKAASLVGGSVRGTAVAFASLPAAPVEGMLVGVTDSNTATWGATIAGSGANHVLGYYNGTNWTVAGK